MSYLFKSPLLLALGLAGICVAGDSLAAISLDRTRVIYVGGEKAISLGVSNENTQLPYLAQAWIENEQGEKVTSPLVVLPPIQRLEPSAHSQVKIQALPELEKLPQDRESLFYFNLREVPPRSNKPNSLQIALQTRVKLFYRPAAIAVKNDVNEVIWQERLILKRQDGRYLINNPTPYYITVIDAAPGINGPSVQGFKPLMLAPISQQDLGVNSSALGEKPVLTYVNDYGGRPLLQFNCIEKICKAASIGTGGSK
ncbi:fimbria/pilus periplasmic chaperone [Pseudomonas aeruginosa]|nr:fimbria/pilus periplasmic chaperone [Pseudomonas aeruginosa]HDZ3441786.1 fimbria/pilus periplasmic chaperone [Pseudomonas aeruginosa]